MYMTLQPLKIALGLLLALTCTCALADFDAAAAAFAAGDYAQAQEQLQPLLAMHDPRAQYSMGVLYENGLGVNKDPRQAVAWYLQSAEQGNSDAQYNLGAMHEHGVGIPVNFAEAARWYRPAAEAGDIDALSNLGVLYANGQGVKQDKILAMALYNVSVAYAENRQTQAKQNRQALANQIPMAELKQSLTLTEELLKPNNLKAGLQAYLHQAH
jgi:TPR repeat protein